MFIVGGSLGKFRDEWQVFGQPADRAFAPHLHFIGDPGAGVLSARTLAHLHDVFPVHDIEHGISVLQRRNGVGCQWLAADLADRLSRAMFDFLFGAESQVEEVVLVHDVAGNLTNLAATQGQRNQAPVANHELSFRLPGVLVVEWHHVGHAERRVQRQTERRCRHHALDDAFVRAFEQVRIGFSGLQSYRNERARVDGPFRQQIENSGLVELGQRGFGHLLALLIVLAVGCLGSSRCLPVRSVGTWAADRAFPRRLPC